MTVLPVAFVVHGAAAVAIILFILVLLVLGAVTFFRLTTRGVKKLSDGASHGSDRA